MIDFRYHLVSIVAVFLALAIGLVLGATALTPLTLRGLQHGISSDKHTIDQLITTGKVSQRQLAADEQFAQVAEPQLLAHLLDGQRVVIVTAPGASGNVTTGVTTALRDAGATVSGQVQLQPRFFDTSAGTQQVLSQVAQQVAPPTLALTGLSPLLQGSKVLANAIVTSSDPTQPASALAAGTGQQVLSGLAADGFVTHSGNPAVRGTLAVVVTPATPGSTSDTNPVTEGLVTIAQQLNLAGQGTVVAGSVAGSGSGSAIELMRAGGRGGHLSSVDNADMVTGQIVVAQALWELLHGVNGNYGVTAGASRVGPSPAPSPSPSASAAVQPATGAGKRTPRATASPARPGGA